VQGPAPGSGQPLTTILGDEGSESSPVEKDLEVVVDDVGVGYGSVVTMSPQYEY